MTIEEECPHCYALNDITAENCYNCGEPINEITPGLGKDYVPKPGTGPRIEGIW